MSNGKSRFKLFFVLAVSFLFAAVLAPINAYAGVESFRDAVKKVNPAVVYIEVTIQSKPDQWSRNALSTGSGSGVIIDGKKGAVLTAAHVVKDAVEAIVQLPDGRKFNAVEIRVDAQTDVAVIFINPDDLPDVQFGDSDTLEVGDWVMAMGSPFGKVLANSVSAGIVSGKGRKTRVLGQMGIEDYIQTDAVINKGNSGGPLVNLAGEVVGINSSIISSNGMSAGLGFAVPSAIIKPVFKQLVENGVVTRGWLGASIAALDKLQGEYKAGIPDSIMQKGGVFVMKALADQPAERAGIRRGDIITEIDGVEVVSPSELTHIVSNYMPGKVIDCKVYRNGDYETIPVTLGLRPGTGDVSGLGSVSQADKTSYAYEKLGIVVNEVSEAIKGPVGVTRISGLKITFVKLKSLAKDFGLNVGEFIIRANGRKVSSKEELEKVVKKTDIRDGIMLTIQGKNGIRKVILKDMG